MKAEPLLQLIGKIRSEGALGGRVSDALRLEVAGFLYKVIAGLIPTILSRKTTLNNDFVEVRRVWEDFFGGVEYWGFNKNWACRYYNWQEPAHGTRTSNFYITLDKTPENITKFMYSIYLLNKKLKEFSSAWSDSGESSSSVAFKTHKSLHLLIQHNDSLKVYFADEANRSEIVGIVRKWLSDNEIATSSRSHEDGYDRNDEGGTVSFGQILAKESAEYVIEYTIGSMKHSTPEEQSAEISKNFSNVVRQNSQRLMTRNRKALP